MVQSLYVYYRTSLDASECAPQLYDFLYAVGKRTGIYGRIQRRIDEGHITWMECYVLPHSDAAHFASVLEQQWQKMSAVPLLLSERKIEIFTDVLNERTDIVSDSVS
ncbi:MAG: DUF4936 family protein [Ottowia sp.]|nr:DUF4936 family protein [Ottowia sp.]